MSGAVSVATVMFGLLKVMVSVETPPALIVAGLKDLFNVGGPIVLGMTTVKVAMAGAALLPLLVCSAPAASVLMKLPAPDAVTFTVTVQEPLAGIEPPVKVTVEPPATAVTVPPVHVVPALPETTTPLGNVSTSGAVSVATVVFGLFKVMVRVETPPALIVAGLKDLLSVGGTFGTIGMTVKAAIAGATLLPLLVCSAPAASVLMKLPAPDAVTLTVTVHEPLAGIEPPVTVTVELPATAVTVVRDAGGAGAARDHHAAGQCVDERRGQRGGRVVRVAQGDGESRDSARIDRGRTERLAQRGWNNDRHDGAGGEGDAVGIHRHGAVLCQCPTRHASIGREGNACQREDIPYEDRARPDRSRAADLPKDIACLSPIDEKHSELVAVVRVLPT